MRWVITAGRGSRLALDASPDEDGTWRILGPITEGIAAQRLTGTALHAAISDGELLWTPHAQTCSANRPLNPCPPEARAILDRALGRRATSEGPTP